MLCWLSRVRAWLISVWSFSTCVVSLEQPPHVFSFSRTSSVIYLIEFAFPRHSGDIAGAIMTLSFFSNWYSQSTFLDVFWPKKTFKTTFKTIREKHNEIFSIFNFSEISNFQKFDAHRHQSYIPKFLQVMILIHSVMQEHI